MSDTTRGRRFVTLSLSFLLLAPIGVGSAATAAAPGGSEVTDVRLDHGRLSLSLRETRLADVLRSIGQRAGVAFVLRGDLSARVTQSFEDLPLDEAIRRLARGYSVAFVYQAPDNRSESVVSRVWIIGSTPDRDPHATTVGVPPVAMSVATHSPQSWQNPPSLAGGDLGRIMAGASARPIAPGSPDADREKRAATERIRTVQDLVRTQGVGAALALQEVLAKEGESRVRLAAVGALASMRSQEAREALETAASDPDESVRRVADRALAKWRYLRP